jgi:hypothetical protein
LAASVASQVQPTTNLFPKPQKIILHRRVLFRRHVGVNDGVILIGGQGLFLACFAPQRHEGKRGGRRPQFGLGQRNCPPQHRVGHRGHDAGHAFHPRATFQQRLDEHRQLGPAVAQLLGRPGGANLAQQSPDGMTLRVEDFRARQNSQRRAALVGHDQVLHAPLLHDARGLKQQGAIRDAHQRSAHDGADRLGHALARRQHPVAQILIGHDAHRFAIRKPAREWRWTGRGP